MAGELDILIAMANPANSEVLSRMLAAAELGFRRCADIDTLLAEAGGGCGALLLEAEFLSAPALKLLQAFLNEQPTWSELPVIFLTRNAKRRAVFAESAPLLVPNLTLLERPVSSAVLATVLRMSLKMRQRQYDIRNLLAELRRANRTLEKRVRRRTAELEQSNKNLEQFAYAASHDLREPLRVVASYLDLLRKRYTDRLDDKANTYISFTVEAAERMQKLIDGLLDYSRLSTMPADQTEVDMNAVFSEAVANLAMHIRDQGAAVTSEPLPVISGAHTQLVQLLQNLICNAVKFARPGIVPEVRVSAVRQKQEWLFSVRDNGIGIQPQFHERIFQIFQRLHTRNEYPGTGIGLALCKFIVERHQGRLWLESSPGEGTTFFFTFPANNEP